MIFGYNDDLGVLGADRECVPQLRFVQYSITLCLCTGVNHDQLSSVS